ncbi:hypothetical protein ACFFRR_007824 [Megaselia abdita]
MVHQKKDFCFSSIIKICVIFLLKTSICDTARIQGQFQTDDFFKFIMKFGFQRIESHSASPREDSLGMGYIFGNITSKYNFTESVTLAVLDKRNFENYYRAQHNFPKDVACQKMFSRLKAIAYESQCFPHGRKDYLRKVPCPIGQLCVDEDAQANVVPGNQFTYVISDLRQPRFWYLSMVACYLNKTSCEWQHYDPKKISNRVPSDQQTTIDFDIHLVNGNPNESAFHPLVYQFSFDKQNLLEMYLIFLLVYIVLVPIQIYAVRLQKHPVTKLFTISLVAEFVSLIFETVHFGYYAVNGIGDTDFETAGDILDIFSRTTFMLILLLLAKGWAVTRQQISRSGWIILMSIWIPYCAFHVLLYIWDRTEVDIMSDSDEYQTWPGWIVLILRTSFMMWFLYELRNTMKYEHSTKKLDFLLHLGASSLVWFIYLPIVAIVALQVNAMWRYKLLLGITNSADCLAYCVMTGLLWPNRAGQYLLLAGPNFSAMDELDEFNEAPHIIRERERQRTSLDSTTSTNNGSSIMVEEDIGDSGLILNGDVSTELLNGDDDIDTDFLTDLNKKSHIIA